MKLIIGKTAGFCFGVKNAISKTYEQLENNVENLYCLGELVHNEKIVNDITQKGVKIVDDIEKIPYNSNVIIRAHGVEPNVYDIAKEKNINIIDLTCPKVTKIHELARDFSSQGYYIMLIAEKNHAETIGTKGFCGKNCSVIEELQDIEKAVQSFVASELNKVAVIAQTTFSMEQFKNFTEIIKQSVKCDIEIKNTICNATAIRQEETENLSKKVDLMIIIGGKKSANTKRLYDISYENCKNSILIQNKDDDDLENAMKNRCELIGIMAGASTPQENIDEVIEYIKSIMGSDVNVVKNL